MKNRLVIYFFYDGDGIVDEYNLVMLRDMMKNCKDLFVVSNGELTEEGRNKFSELTNQILERENKGFDVGAYKEAILTIGWDKLAQYDEVILMNYTIMGPVFPFKEMFDAMDQKDVDFWGITKYHEVKVDPYGMIRCGYLREHIQSHFIAVRREMLTGEAFKAYWEEMPVIKSYGESVALHESYFTHHFAKRGYKWDVYVNTDDMKKYTEYPLLKDPKKLIEQKRCPIFKRRNFNHDYIDFMNTTVGQPTYELMEYLKNHTTYDVDLIWDNILRTCNQSKIKECLQLNYVLPSNQSKDITDILQKRKIALVLHLYYEDLLEESYLYACSMPKEADVFVTVGSEKMKLAAEKIFSNMPNQCRIMQIPNRGRDVGSVLVAVNPEILKYDIVCFAHDKKVTQLTPECKGASWAYQCFESVLKNEDYVKNVIATFEENPRLGLLTPAPPIHAEYFPTMGNEWAANFKNAKELAKKLGIHVPMSKDCPPISALGCFFWYRPKAMKKLYDRQFTYEDFPEEPMKKTDGSILHALERLYSFAVQDAGYYPAWLFSDNIGAMEITNLYFMLRELNLAIASAGLSGTFVDVINEMKRRAPAMRSISDLHYALMGLYGEKPKSNKEFSTIMNLYYTEDTGYTQDDSVMCRASFRENKFGVEFEIPEGDKPIRELRFDPGEEGMVILKKLTGLLEYEDGSQEIIKIEQCTSNGYPFESKILFIGEDPQVYIKCSEEKRVRNVIINGKLKRDITQDKVQKVISQSIPQMTPKMYYDCGNGICEQDSLQTMNQGNVEQLNARFVLNTPENIKAFRFDPCEQGTFVLKNLQMNIVYADQSKEVKKLEKCITNGYKVNDRICFIGEDPQVIWENEQKLAVKEVIFTAEINQEFSQDVLREIRAKSLESSGENSRFWRRK